MVRAAAIGERERTGWAICWLRFDPNCELLPTTERSRFESALVVPKKFGNSRVASSTVLWIRWLDNGHYFVELRPNSTITATGPAGAVELTARPASINEPILIQSGHVQADATWTLNPNLDRAAAPNSSARR